MPVDDAACPMPRRLTYADVADWKVTQRWRQGRSYGEIRTDGTHTVRTLGDYIEEPIELIWHDDLKLCGQCKVLSHWRTKRGRATHPTCEPDIDRLDQQAAWRVIGHVVQTLKPTSIAEERWS